ncbi:hypothetical protein PA598K_04003 [Paenibacillus sp. 598K]|uniref:ATP-grasp domain-containing protein n=1 Tax=Paenibacillus sp. 598K TaxID=1117987 RepID=UPI000FF913EC|nr:ATP-grasp domain-containing protein [Paenibacillus sp. 598K]GBF75585.1 hypothetical protein PA598K_04003 [Paenibacillus sp. 598K]
MILNTIKQKKYWVYNVNQEQKWNVVSEFPSIQDAQQLELVKQQEQQMLFAADSTDTVLFRYKPDDEFLTYLKNEGIVLPKMQIADPYSGRFDNLEALSDKAVLTVPYIVTSDLYEEFGLDESINLYGAKHDLVKRLNNKFETRRFAENNLFQTTKGFFCTNEDELRLAYNKLKQEGFERCVLKIAYGSSGKGLKLIDNDRSFNLLLKFITRRNKQFYLLLEGWYTVRQNINCQLFISTEEVQILAVTEQQIDNNGVYMGTNFTPYYEAALVERYKLEMLRLGRLLQGQGYRGICGVDSIIDQEGSLFPIIEINARLTQVSYLISQVMKLKQQYQVVESRFIRFNSSSSLNFNTVYNIVEKAVVPSQENRFLIYTFARHNSIEFDCVLYRVFVLFYGDDRSAVEAMIVRFNGLNGEFKTDIKTEQEV